jgi:hypothetical protein
MAYASKFNRLGCMANGQNSGTVDIVCHARESTRSSTKETEMGKLILMAALVMVGAAAEAKKNCTDLPKDKWMSQEDFKKRIEGEGFKIRKFKQPGSCYEIYGTNKEGKNVEIYFNPVDGSIVKEE